jgi:hypothetical protein
VVRPETVRGSGAKAARHDLESAFPLGERTAFQDALVAGQGEAVAHRLGQAAAETAAVNEELADVERGNEWRRRDVKVAEEALANAVGRLGGIPKSRQLGQIPGVVYGLILALFAAGDYPLVKLSFTSLPLDDASIRLVSVLVGAMLVAGAHVLGLAVSRLVLAEGDLIEGRRDWLVQRAVVGAGAALYVFVVVGLAVVRTSEITAIGRVYAGLGPSQPLWLGIALGCLHAATLLCTFYLAYHRARGIELRDAQAQVSDLEAERNAAEKALEGADRREARLLVKRESIADQEDHDLDQLTHHYQFEDASYRAVLACELESPPKPITDWGTTRAPRRGPRLPAGPAAPAESEAHGNGRPSLASAPPASRSLPAHDRKEERP